MKINNYKYIYHTKYKKCVGIVYKFHKKSEKHHACSSCKSTLK